VVLRFLISPPFGNWIRRHWATSVRGSFTWDARPGLVYHALKSLRPVKGGWVNRIGLRNPGVRSVTFDPTCIYSLVGMNDGDWERMLDRLPEHVTPEVNLGCPNVHRYGIAPAVLRDYCAKFGRVIAKLPPTDDVDDMAAMCVEAGVQYLHLCNTLPTERGGESGERLFYHALPIVERVAYRHREIEIIAGGGIYRPIHLHRYWVAGATHFSLATVWFTPWRVKHILHAGYGTWPPSWPQFVSG
jgi:dihydroorotate dehydrogenase